MKKSLSHLLLAPMLAISAGAFAQCNVSIATSNGCAPTTLTVNAGFSVESIVWQLNGVTVQSDSATWSTTGTTVAGGNGQGNAANQLNMPWFGNIDAQGNIYIADNGNYRVQMWAPGATTGVTVAGGNGAGSGANQLTDVRGAWGLDNGTVYASDQENNRIMQWLPGATSGTVIAGGNGFGDALNQFSNQYCVVVDHTGNLFVADFSNNRIMEWAVGATTGVVVAGGNGAGNAANQLNNPYGCYVDDSENIYAMDVLNNRVQKWLPGATSGITVAGGNGYGSGLNKMGFPFGLYVDKWANVYIADQGNNRITVWHPGATTASLIAGGFAGNGPDQLNSPSGVWLDADGNAYAADQNNGRVQKYAVSIVNTFNATTQGTYTVIVRGFNGCSDTITYTPGIDAAIAAANPTTFCAGDTVRLSATQGTGDTYQWTSNGTNITGATDSTYTANAAGTYGVVITNGGCSGTATPVVVTVNPTPTPTIAVNGNVLSATPGFTSYQWYLDGQAIPGATNADYTTTGNGHYSVKATNASGCTGSASIPLAVGNVNAAAAVSIYPNPSSAIVYINAPANAHISVSSADGRELIQKDNAKQIDLSSYPDGVYLIKITSKDGQMLKMDKIVKSVY